MFTYRQVDSWPHVANTHIHKIPFKFTWPSMTLYEQFFNSFSVATETKIWAELFETLCAVRSPQSPSATYSTILLRGEDISVGLAISLSAIQKGAHRLLARFPFLEPTPSTSGSGWDRGRVQGTSQPLTVPLTPQPLTSLLTSDIAYLRAQIFFSSMTYSFKYLISCKSRLSEF